MKQAIAVFLMGYSGSGKDTQAGLLGDFLKARDGASSVLFISTGDALRALIKTDSFMGRWVDEHVMKAGAKAPDSLAIWAWQERLNRAFTGHEHLIFSSSPRTVLEARVFDDFAKAFGRKSVYPIYLEVGREEAFRRLKARGRADDTDETIGNRLDYFSKAVGPAVEYFKTESENHLVTIDSNSQDPQKIHEDVLRALQLS